MKKNIDYCLLVLTTAIAPAIWGSTYVVTTSFLPQGYPLTVALLRALPAGIILLLLVRKLPEGIWWARVFVLGALNFAFFWSMLFVSAYRLPGGVAATVGAVQPLIVIALSRIILETPVRPATVAAGLVGIGGVALLVLTPTAALDGIGILAGLAGAVSMSFGMVLTRRWRPPVSNLTFTAWQLAAGGILLIPVALVLEPPLPALSFANIAGLAYLGIIGAALTYVLWLRGLSRLEPSAVAPLGFLSPVVATLLGWLALDQSLTPFQLAGFVMVLFSVWLSQKSQMPKSQVASLKPTRPCALPAPWRHRL